MEKYKFLTNGFGHHLFFNLIHIYVYITAAIMVQYHSNFAVPMLS